MIIQYEPSPAVLKWRVQRGELLRSQFPIDGAQTGAEEPKYYIHGHYSEHTKDILF